MAEQCSTCHENVGDELGNYSFDRHYIYRSRDFTRAFRRWPKLRNPRLLMRCDRELFESLRALTRESLDEALSAILNPSELEGLWARRGLILEHYRALIRERGEEHTLY